MTTIPPNEILAYILMFSGNARANEVNAHWKSVYEGQMQNLFSTYIKQKTLSNTISTPQSFKKFICRMSRGLNIETKTKEIWENKTSSFYKKIDSIQSTLSSLLNKEYDVLFRLAELYLSDMNLVRPSATLEENFAKFSVQLNQNNFLSQVNYLWIRAHSSINLDHFPLAFAKLNKLKILMLEHQKISLLPEKMKHLTSLEYLKVAHCSLRTIPPELCEIKTLKHVIFDGNFIRELPPDLNQMQQLCLFSIQYNLLTTLPPEYCELPCLPLLLGNPIRYIPAAIVEKFNRFRSFAFKLDRDTPIVESFIKINSKLTDALKFHILEMSQKKISPVQQYNKDASMKLTAQQVLNEMKKLLRLSEKFKQATTDLEKTEALHQMLDFSTDWLHAQQIAEEIRCCLLKLSRSSSFRSAIEKLVKNSLNLSSTNEAFMLCLLRPLQADVKTAMKSLRISKESL